MRDEPGEPRLAALARALGLVLATGCGPTQSLDAIGPATSSGAGTTGSSTHGSADTSTAGEDAPPPDVPATDLPAPPLAPGECPAGCVVDLPLAWAWDEEPRPPAEPPDPSAVPRLSAMIRALDGSLVVATRRNDEPWLTQVDRDGGLVASMPLPLQFECEIVDMTLYPSGKLILLAECVLQEYQVLEVIRFDLGAWFLESEAWNLIAGTEDRPARTGSVMPLSEELDEVAVLVVESAVTPEGLDQDAIQIFYYANGGFYDYRLLDTQLAHAPPRRPKSALLPTGEIVMTVSGLGTDMGDYAVWLAPDSLLPLTSGLLRGPADALAVGPDGKVVVAGHAALPSPPLPLPAQVVLQATGLPRTQPPTWESDVYVLGTTVSGPVVAMDALGHAYLAMRTTAGAPHDLGAAAVALVRLAADGTPVWSTTLPLASDATPLPIGLSLADDDESLVLATIVDGHLHLEQREQGCRCEQ
jgi:hypothetical protein